MDSDSIGLIQEPPRNKKLETRELLFGKMRIIQIKLISAHWPRILFCRQIPWKEAEKYQDPKGQQKKMFKFTPGLPLEERNGAKSTMENAVGGQSVDRTICAPWRLMSYGRRLLTWSLL